jgi:hypothetical protein
MRQGCRFRVLAVAICVFSVTRAVAEEEPPPKPPSPPVVAQADGTATSVALAQAEAPALPGALPPTVSVAKPAPRPPGRFLTYASFAFNAYTYLGATASAPSTNLTPASRGLIYQQLGFGYFVHPMVRLTLTLLFGETVSSAPANTSTFSALAVIPWVVFTTHGFWTGAGPSLAPISYGKAPNFDAGIYTATGYTFKLPRDLSLSPGVQLVLMLNQRTSFAVTPTVAFAYRF